MRALELVSLTLANFITATMLLLCPILIIASSHSESNEDISAGGRIVYDQRQNGKYNIHVSIKDVAIIEVDQNELADETFDEGDYYYDDSDLTVKPIKFTTSAPMTTGSYDFSTTSSAAINAAVGLTDDETLLATTTNRFVASTTNGLPSNITYSPNLLADIAATQAAQQTTKEPQTLQAIVGNNTTKKLLPSTSTTQRPRNKTQNLVIVTNSTENSIPLTSKKGLPSPLAVSSPLVPMPALFNDLRARTKDIPIQSSVNEPNTHQEQHHYQQQQHSSSSSLNENSRIFKVKVQRAAGQPQQQKLSNTALTAGAHHLQPTSSRRCRANQYRDASGNCRSKRSSASTSSSFLRKLFSMLVSLPFASERSYHPYQHQHQHHHHLQHHQHQQEQQEASAIHDADQ